MKGKEEDISITVNIAGVPFPLLINPSEEEKIRKAELLMNERLKAFKTKYNVTDRQTLLSMLSIHLASDLVNYEENTAGNDSGLNEKLRHLNEMLDTALNEK